MLSTLECNKEILKILSLYAEKYPNWTIIDLLRNLDVIVLSYNSLTDELVFEYGNDTSSLDVLNNVQTADFSIFPKGIEINK